MYSGCRLSKASEAEMKKSVILQTEGFVVPARDRNRFSSFKASALLMVLWGLAMMSITVMGVVEYVHYDLEETTSMEKNSRTRQLAEAGVAIGMHPLMKKGEGLLNQVFAPGESFEVHLRSEGGRLNINMIVQKAQWQILHNLFVIWGLTESDAAKVTEAFKTWTNADKWQELVSSQNGNTITVVAGQPGTQLPPHQFQSLEEMRLIPGVEVLAGAKPDWMNNFTVWSDGPLDVNEAPSDLIMAVSGVGEVQAQRLIKIRLGPDGKPDTDDDFIFQSMDQVQQALGLSPNDFANIQNRISLQDSVTRIESMGSIGTYQQRVIVVCRRNSNPPVYFLWQEQ